MPISQPTATPVSPNSSGQLAVGSGQLPEASPTPPTTDDPDAGLRKACADTLDELVAARKLIAAQGNQLQADAQLQALQDQISTGLKDLRVLDAAEKQKLRDAVDAANREIAALKDEVKILKKQRMTFWKKLKYGAIGVAAGVVVGALVLK